MKTTRKIFLALVLTLCVAAVLSVCAFAALNFETDMPAGVQKGETGWIASGYTDVDTEAGWYLVATNSKDTSTTATSYPTFAYKSGTRFYWNKTTGEAVWLLTSSSIAGTYNEHTVSAGKRNELADGVYFSLAWMLNELANDGYVFKSIEFRLASGVSSCTYGPVGLETMVAEAEKVLFDSRVAKLAFTTCDRGIIRSSSSLKTLAHVTYNSDKSGEYTGTVKDGVIDLSGFTAVTPYRYRTSSSTPYIRVHATSDIFMNSTGVREVIFFNSLVTDLSVTTDAGDATIGKDLQLAGYIDYRSFYGASSLEKLTLTAPLTEIRESAFYNCKKITTIDLQGGIADGATIASNAFTGVTQTVEIIVYTEADKAKAETLFSNISATIKLDAGEEPDEPEEPKEPATMPVGVDKTSDKWTNSGYTDVDTEDGWYLMSGNEDYSTTTTSFPTFAALAGGRFYWNKTTGEAVWLVTSSNMSGNSGEENPVSLTDPTVQANTQMRFYAYASCFVDVTNKTGNDFKTHFAGGTSEKKQYVTQNATNYPIYERYIQAGTASKQWSDVIVTAQAYADFVAYKATLGYAEDAAVEDTAHQDLLVEWAFANIAPYKQLRNCLEDGAKFNMAWIFAQLEKEDYVFTKVEFRAAKGVTPYYGTVGLVAKCLEAETILMDSKINDLRFTNTDRGLFIDNSSLRTFAHVTYNTDMSGEYTGTVKTGVVNLSGFAKVTTYTVSDIVRAFSDLLEKAGMTEVVWFNSVKSGDTEYAGHIDTDVLREAKNLTKVTLTAPLTAIAANAFNGATALKTIDLKGGVASDVTVASTAFSGATQSIEAIVYSNAAKTALESALSTAGIKNVTITLVTTTPDAANNAIRADGYSIRLNDDNAKTPGPALRAEFTLLNSNIAAAKAEGFDLSSYGVIVFSANTLNGTTYNGDIDAVLEAAKAGTDTRIIVKSAVNGPYVNGAALETNPDLDKVFAAAITGIPEGNFTSAIYTYAYAVWTDGTDTYYTYTTYTSDRTKKTAHSLYDLTIFSFRNGIANSQNTDADKLWPVLEKGAFSVTKGQEKAFAAGLELNVAYTFDANNKFTYLDLPLRAWERYKDKGGSVAWDAGGHHLEETSSTNVLWSILTDGNELVVVYRPADNTKAAVLPYISDSSSYSAYAPFSPKYFTPGPTAIWHTYKGIVDKELANGDSTTNGLYKYATIYSPIVSDSNAAKITALVLDHGITKLEKSAWENTSVTNLSTIVYSDGISAGSQILANNSSVKTVIYAPVADHPLPAATQAANFGTVIDLSGIKTMTLGNAFSGAKAVENIILPVSVTSTSGVQTLFNGCTQLKRVWTVGADVPAAATIDLTGANKLTSVCKNAFYGVPVSTIIMPASFQGVADYSMKLQEADPCARVFGIDQAHTIVLGANPTALTLAYTAGKNGGLIAYYDKLHTIATTDDDYNNVDMIKVTCTVDDQTMTKTLAEWKAFFATYVEPEVEPKVLPFKAGVNVSGMDTYMSDNQWGILERGISIATKEFTYTNIKSQGFDYIRLPVNFYSVYYEAPTGKYDYTTDQMMGYVDTAIDLAIKNGLYVMLDFHGWFTIGAEQNDYDEFLYCWTQLANRYKDYSDMLVFELLNEPWYDNGKAQPYLSDSRLYQMQAEAIEIIRATGSNNADRLIVLCTADGNKAWKLSAMQVPDDDNIAVAIHEYDPDAFTGQGFTWAGKVHGDQVRLNPETDLSGVNYDFSQIRKFMEANPNVPIILNEFGLNLDLAADEDISYYVRYLTQFCADNNIPWAYWHYDGNDYSSEWNYTWKNRDGEFALYRQHTTKGVFEWDTLALDALFLR